MVQKLSFDDKDLLNVYQWLLTYPDSQELLQLTDQRVFPPAVFMEASHLHCTANVVDDTCQYYDENFLLECVNDELMLKARYWSSLNSAISVTLTPTQHKLYQIPGAVPHISLASYVLEFAAQCYFCYTHTHTTQAVSNPRGGPTHFTSQGAH